ncbi:hypothetical protein PPYR_01126 [Photinus pyralis]|uniref:Uncharacterized protein n=1 Tax=Photinus pyralis TaxID=7054 RepID=A0A5N4B3L0_PHOPY|nr:uncharacterized protein LOC116159294 [Photinus pyralis]XP_031328110.1 uncharacterized protein LOC116159294 [Photinus pyralis]KAB0804156.1 hypothetical protein PPYR_01126 [Photinus pyralis]
MLMYDNPDRFKTCSLRLLKDHMLEQICKYRKYDSEEASESGKERLQTPWGANMRELMEVWDTYTKLVNADKVLHTANAPGRPKKGSETQKKNEVEVARRIRDAALGTITQSCTNELQTVQEQRSTSDDGCQTPTARQHTKVATKRRTNKDEMYLHTYQRKPD